MLKEKTIGFVGGGRMCEAILSGALHAGVLVPSRVHIFDPDAQRAAFMQKTYGVAAAQDPLPQWAAACHVLLLCVKPQVLPGVLRQLSGVDFSGKLVISIVGGVPLATLEEALPGAAVIRVMPNTPMLVRQGVAGISPGRRASPAQTELCRTLFDAVGESYLLTESLIDPLTAVSGCGPAFACLFIEALADGGVEQGLPRQTALRLAAQTLAGTALMMLETGEHPAVLKDNVCSPGGGTIAGVHALEEGAFRAAVMQAVAAARQRMEQLGRTAPPEDEPTTWQARKETDS